MDWLWGIRREESRMRLSDRVVMAFTEMRYTVGEGGNYILFSWILATTNHEESTTIIPFYR